MNNPIIELLYFDGCPTQERLLPTLEQSPYTAAPSSGSGASKRLKPPSVSASLGLRPWG